MTDHSDDGLKGIAKAIADLDGLVQGILLSLPEGKPWQRQMRSLLADAGRNLLVMRVTISLERGNAEVVQAAHHLQRSMQAADAYGAASRASKETKAALGLARRLSQKVCASLSQLPVAAS